MEPDKNTNKTSDAQLRAIKNYRKRNPEKYNAYQNTLYNKYKDNPEWVKTYNLKHKEYNVKYIKQKRMTEIIRLLDTCEVKDWNSAVDKISKLNLNENVDYLISRLGEMPKITKGGKIAKPRGRPRKNMQLIE